ncbi:UPF0182 family protein [Haloimpatiens sp. FM7330]|uniref:UPF0182 family protein n=1 Tax=Haloimpatiens sp. FM7330 TaxID=3298610 RepID=UPI0036273F13
MRKRYAGFTIIGIIIFVALFLDTIVNFVVNIKWFQEVNYLSVYLTKISAVFKLMIPVFILIYITIWLYYRSLKKCVEKWNSEKKVITFKKSNKFFMIFDIIVSLIISISISTNYWYRILQFTNAENFNVTDPIFNIDISFYIFKLPLIESIYNIFMILLIVLVVVTLITYFLLNAKDRMSIRGSLQNAKEFKSGLTKFAGRQLAIVSALILLLLSLGYMIKAWNLVYSPRGVVFGASYTDVKVSLLFYKIIVVVSLIASIVVFISVLTSKVKPIFASIIIIVGLIVVENAAAIIVQNLIVRSNEKTVEQEYITHNIKYTRKGFNIDKTEESQYAIKNNLTTKSLKNNEDTIKNIKINSFKPALEYYNQLQVSKYYYSFNDIDVDRYNINNRYTQVFVSPREIDVDLLKDKANTWQNRHLTYTHGYGIVMNKVNTVTSSGKPDFVVKDIPIQNNLNVKIDNPRIYFGEKTNDYAIVNTKLGELDYPEGSKNKMTNYKGKAGIKMNFANKVLFSLYNKNIKFLLSKDITNDSKILINRNIVDRVKKIAPFLVYDKDPYIVADNKKLYWVIDAYTVSNRYPFSQPYNGINYIRNSVKVVIDAVDGTTNFYIVDKNDPIVKSFSNIFPKLFKDYKQVPESLKKHFKYPEDLFNIQCKVLGKYHVTNPLVFYSSDDLWEISKNEKQVNNVEQDDERNSASYVIMKLPKENKEEMVILQYFNVNKKNNMVSLFCARMDKDNYGKLNLYKFPQESIDSPYLFKQNIKQDPVISKEISFWNQEGSKVQFGDTVIVPIENSLLYVEPLYIRASGKDSIPQMKRVIVSYGDKMVLAQDIDDAIKQIFNYGKKDEIQDTTKKKDTVDIDKITGDIDKNIKRAKTLYDKAVEAQKRGDWAKYGEYIKELGELLGNISTK